tara:strand:+ start:220 stop:618 length:399 start_codon:yes stop_codon:yes gene_type:complete
MYSKETLAGIILSNATLQIQANKDLSYKLGYSLKIKVVLRGRPEYLEAIHRSLLQQQIDSTIRVVESKSRPKPILFISRISDLIRLQLLIPRNIPCNKFDRSVFERLIEMLYNKEHLTLKGLDEILKIKEAL